MSLVELVNVTTVDGIRLDGAWHAPAEDAALGSLGVDVVISVHGAGANFYGSTLLIELAARLEAEGTATLRINTRGHDLMSSASSPLEPRRVGAAYEIIDECRHDLAAWVEFARGRGRRVALAGHSLGALKSVYALAHGAVTGVVGLIAVSAPRLCYERFVAGPQGEAFRDEVRQAEELVARGQAGTLIEMSTPLPYWVGAGACVDKYGARDRYDITRYLARVACPALFVYGAREMETSPAFDGMAETVSNSSGGGPRQAAVIAGADHFYVGCREELASVVVRWMRRSLASDSRGD